MRLVTFRAEVNAASRLGALVENHVVDLNKLGGAAGHGFYPDNMLDFIELGPAAITSATPAAGLL